MKKEIRQEKIIHPTAGELTKSYEYEYDEKVYSSLDEAIECKKKFEENLAIKQAEFDTKIVSTTDHVEKSVLIKEFQDWQDSQRQGFSGKQLYET